jgi:hypothetical protein
MNNNPTQTLLTIANHIITTHPEIRTTLDRVMFEQRNPIEKVAAANVDLLFPAFTPKSGGTPVARTEATIDAINNSFPALVKLSQGLEYHDLIIEELETSFLSPEQIKRTQLLETLLNKLGSDKAQTHAYHHFYANVFEDQSSVRNILEVGLGTNNLDVLSSMGPQGRPGASLRAFRDYFPNAQILGCDVDKRILFTEDRITTAYVDQTKPETFEDLDLAADFDLLIDDGLHSPHANLSTLTFFLKCLKIGGYAVVEDIGVEAYNIWQVVYNLLPEKYSGRLFKSRYTNSMLFSIRRNF